MGGALNSYNYSMGEDALKPYVYTLSTYPVCVCVSEDVCRGPAVFLLVPQLRLLLVKLDTQIIALFGKVCIM